MICPSCGRERGEAAICPGCGAGPQAPAPPVQPAQGAAPPQPQGQPPYPGYPPHPGYPPYPTYGAAPGGTPYAVGVYPYPQSKTTNPKAIVSLVLGILGITSCYIVSGLPALIVGYLARREIKDSPETQDGNGLAVAGIVLGWISVGLTVVLAVSIVLVAMLSAAGSGSG